MLANLPVEIILLICQYPKSKELRQLAWTNKRVMQIIKKYLPTALERKILFYLPYQNSDISEGKICLFDSHTNSVKQIANFTDYLGPYEVVTTKDKIFGIDCNSKSFKIFDVNTRQISRGSDPPEWREYASVAYFKDKLYYLGGEDPKTHEWTNRVDVLIDGKWQTGPAFPLPIKFCQTIICDKRLYVTEELGNKRIYRLSGNEREWIEVGEIPEGRGLFGVASLNGRIYITGGFKNGEALKSCLCFDPSAPANSRISQIADMNYARYGHSLVVANEKLYAIGGFQKNTWLNFCDSIEEYDPQTNEWRKARKLRNLPAIGKIAGKKTRTNRTKKDNCLLS